MMYFHWHYIDSGATPIERFENEEFRSLDVETQVVDVVNSDYVQNVAERKTNCLNSLDQDNKKAIMLELA